MEVELAVVVAWRDETDLNTYYVNVRRAYGPDERSDSRSEHSNVPTPGDDHAPHRVVGRVVQLHSNLAPIKP
jgi:hypothetical protein